MCPSLVQASGRHTHKEESNLAGSRCLRSGGRGLDQRKSEPWLCRLRRPLRTTPTPRGPFSQSPGGCVSSRAVSRSLPNIRPTPNPVNQELRVHRPLAGHTSATQVPVQMRRCVFELEEQHFVLLRGKCLFANCAGRQSQVFGALGLPPGLSPRVRWAGRTAISVLVLARFCLRNCAGRGVGLLRRGLVPLSTITGCEEKGANQ